MSDETPIISPSEKRELLFELQDRVYAYVKTRFWILAAIVFIVGFFGTRAYIQEIVNGQLREATKAATIAEQAGKDATEATKRARKSTDDYSEAVENLQAKAQDVDRQFTQLTSKQAMLEADIVNRIAKSGNEVEGLAQRLAQLEKFAGQLAQKGGQQGDFLAQYEKKLADIQQNTTIAKLEFDQNSKVTIGLYAIEANAPTQLLTDLSTKLSLDGYKVFTKLIPAGVLDMPKMNIWTPNYTQNPDFWFNFNSDFTGIAVRFPPDTKDTADRLAQIVAETYQKVLNVKPQVSSQQAWDTENRFDYAVRGFPPGTVTVFIAPPRSQ